MVITMNIILLITLALCGGFYLYTNHLKQNLETLRSELRTLKTATGHRQVDELLEVGAGSESETIRTMIAIEITNVFELAQRESKIAGYVSNLAPDLVKEKVYQQVVENMREELAREGVENEISIIYQ